MSKKRRVSLLIGIGVATLVSSASSYSHHSPAAFNVNEEVTFTGEVVDYSFRNPHVYITLSVEQENGEFSRLEVEAGAGSVIAPLGFTRDALEEGDVVTVFGSPSRRNPDRLMLGRELYKQDGTYFPLHIQSRSAYEETDAVASSIEGTWFSARADFYAYLGQSREWPLTIKGRDAIDNLDPLNTPQKDCIPLASPTLLLYPVANTITVSEEQVVFDIDWLDSERIVYMDGRDHPDASETFLHGHSVGHWEGDTLVIDSTNYTDHPMGLSFYLPGGKGKHLIERISLNEDGKGISYSGQTVDEEYITETVEWSGEWSYRPEMQHSNEACDLEVAHRFLDD